MQTFIIYEGYGPYKEFLRLHFPLIPETFADLANLRSAFIGSSSSVDRAFKLNTALTSGLAELAINKEELLPMYPENDVLPTYDEFVVQVAKLLKGCLDDEDLCVRRL